MAVAVLDDRFDPDPFALGIEEDYLLVDAQTYDLVDAPPELMAACTDRLAGHVSPEVLQCQIEVGPGVCATIAEARDDPRHLRRTVADCAAGFGLAPLAASCHPFADWKDQPHTDRNRDNQLARDLGEWGSGC